MSQKPHTRPLDPNGSVSAGARATSLFNALLPLLLIALFAALIFLVLSSIPASAGSSTATDRERNNNIHTLLDDGFESDLGAWTVSTDDDGGVVSTDMPDDDSWPHSGSHAAYFYSDYDNQLEEMTLTATLDLEHYTDVYLEYYWRSEDLEVDNEAMLDIYDGAWHEEVRAHQVDNDRHNSSAGDYTLTQIELSAFFNMVDGFKIRYRVKMEGSYEYDCFILDDVEVYMLNEAPQLFTTPVEPPIGNPGTNFTFMTTYKDVDNDAPAPGYPQVAIFRDPDGLDAIDGSPFTMIPVNLTDTNYTDGRTYKYAKVLDEANLDYTYRIFAQAAHGNTEPVATAFVREPMVDGWEVSFDPVDYDPDGWLQSRTVSFSITVDDGDGAGVDTSTIAYSYSTTGTGAGAFSRWKYVNMSGDAASVRCTIVLTLEEGVDNYVRFRASDLAQNGPTRSDDYRLRIDGGAPSVTPLTPTSNHWLNHTSVTCSVRFDDRGGSGYNTSGMEYRFTTAGDGAFTDWIAFDGDAVVRSTWATRGDSYVVNPNGSFTWLVTITFVEGRSNAIQWRGWDKAGNGPRASRIVEVFIDSRAPQFRNGTPDPAIWQPHRDVECSIEIDDRPGSGTDLDTLQYSVATAGPNTFGPWLDIVVENDTAAALATVHRGERGERGRGEELEEPVRVLVEVRFENGSENYIRWRVRDHVGNPYRLSEPHRVRVDAQANIPPAVELRYPQNGTTLTTTQPVFLWSGSDRDGHRIYYDLYLSTDRALVAAHDHSAAVYRELNTSRVENTVQNGELYYWTVVPTDHRDVGSCLDGIWNFHVDRDMVNTAPLAELLAPSDGVTLDAGAITLRWTGEDPDGTAILYDLYFSTDADAVKQRDESTLLATDMHETSFTIEESELDEDEIYYWTVIPNDRSESGSCPDGVFSFIVDTENAAPTATLLSPSDGSEITPQTPLEWSGADPDPGDTELVFDIYLSQDRSLVEKRTPRSRIVQEQVETVLDISHLAQGGVYYWTVIPSDGSRRGPCQSGVWSFSYNTSDRIYDLELALIEERSDRILDRLELEPGEQLAMILIVKNHGNARDIVTIDIVGNATAHLEIEIEIEINAEESAVFELGATELEEVAINVTLRSDAYAIIDQSPFIMKIVAQSYDGVTEHSLSIPLVIDRQTEPSKINDTKDVENAFIALFGSFYNFGIFVLIVLILFTLIVVGAATARMHRDRSWSAPDDDERAGGTAQRSGTLEVEVEVETAGGPVSAINGPHQLQSVRNRPSKRVVEELETEIEFEPEIKTGVKYKPRRSDSGIVHIDSNGVGTYIPKEKLGGSMTPRIDSSLRHSDKPVLDIEFEEEESGN